VLVSAAVPPTGVVTFLFTDIEGSTRRWEADADDMRVSLVAHDKVLRNAIEAHGGFLFSHTGDGVVAAFASPMSAVNAAVDGQRELQVPVRMGIATGEAELRDGDYFGRVLNRAARIMAAGHGGQILVADSTAGLLSDVQLLNLGSRQLRDVASPITVFQLNTPGLPDEFPPLRTLDASPGNLRAATTSLTGREREVVELTAAVRTHRLVTLIGVGGAGKTRLATEVAGRLVNEFPDGVWVFELATVTDPAAVPDAVAAALGIPQQPDKSVSESIAAAMGGSARLMVFDNCEHVRDAAADLAETILAVSGTVRVLATSREGLRIADEQLWPVPALDVGAGLESAAVALFVERARSVASDFSLDNADEADAVLEICRRVDGIPLAIELAASRMASMTAIEVRDRLDRRFRLLVGSRRGLARHQTLWQAVAWSYDLLDDAEKSLLARCSAFSGGFDVRSVCAVAGFDDSDDYAVLDLLDALVRKSLIVAARSSGRTRYSMLETIREFAEERLVASGAAEQVRVSHARYFAAREDDILTLWDSLRQREAYTWFVTELANLRTAFRWAADHDDLDDAATIATYAALLGLMVENYEPIAWAEELIEPARAADHPRLAALYVTASLCWMPGRIERAVQYSDAGRNAIRGDDHGLPGGIQGWLGATYLGVGQPERCVEWAREELSRGRDTHAMTRAGLAIALRMTGRDEEAMAAATGIVEAAEAARNPWALSFALLAFGLAHGNENPVRALHALRRGLAVAQDSGNRGNESHLAGAVAHIEGELGDPLAALEQFARTIRSYHDSGNTAHLHTVLGALVVLFDRLGGHEQAARIAGFAVTPLSLTAVPGLPTAIAHLRETLGQTYESLARDGKEMTTSAIATFAYDQIDQARAELDAISN
jgi:predicted ATPase/class 3 adenylate cyclase